MKRLLGRLIEEEHGQDLIEYALLSAFVGLVGVVAWSNISTKIGVAYQSWDTSVQGISACTPDPGGGGCP
jgi:pilus assembly protein Flp/PilA